MAAVLDALAPYVKKMIADLAEEEVHMLLGVSSEIRKLEGNLESLKYFLADAERKRITDQSVQRWVRKLKDAMYDATDILDLCQLEADERRESKGSSTKDKAPGFCQPLLFCLRNPVFAHKIGSRIMELNQRLDDIRKGANEFNFNINLSSYPDHRVLVDAESSIFKTMSEFDESAIVGEKIEKDTKELVQVLVANDYHNIKVVSIVGMGGVGKTTLAQKIFKEATIQEHFKIKIWLSINQHFDEAELLRTAISHAGGHHGGQQDKSILTQTLTDALSSSKFMLVMDDVWSDKAWNHVLSVPTINGSNKQPGSRILVTTRFEDLARRMQASLHQHHVSPLDEEDAWSLLKQQLPPNQVIGIDELKDVGMRIIRKCDGLPLAIKVMGGLLSTRYPSEHEWEAVLNSPAWSVAGLPQELDNRLYLSYEDLSPQLKQCFLHCSLIPKDSKILRSVVTRMWISEGFIEPLKGSFSHDQLEEVATEYHRELINRNLIEPTEYSYNGHTCTMHDVVRAFAQFMVREESLVVQNEQAAAGSGGNNNLVRRMSVGPTNAVPDWAVLQKQESLRTLIISCRVNFQPGDSFSNLRVLFIQNADFDSMVESLCQMKHLRYLHLEETDISRLPNQIDKMKFLQHILLLSCKKLQHLPDNIIKLARLRTLEIDGSNVSAVPKRFGALTNLRSLYGFPVHIDGMDGRRWCSLEEIAPLSELRRLRLDGLESVPAGSLAEKAMISRKGHLSYLELHCNRNSMSVRPAGGEVAQQQQQQQRVIEEVFNKLRPPNCIERLVIDGGYFGRRLPNWMAAPASAAFKSLRFITLSDLLCCTHLPNGLCQLFSLESMLIMNAPTIKHVGPEFQGSLAGDDEDDTSAAFPKLRSLELHGLPGWEKWDWEEQEDVKASMVMPALEYLYIHNCKLSRLPPGLANIKRHALRKLKLLNLTNLTSLENFPSVVHIDVFNCPKLKRIGGLSMLQKARISSCPNLEVLEGVPILDSIILVDTTMETVPGYLRGVNPRYLKLDCSKKLYKLLSPGSSEWDKISHIRTHAIDSIKDGD